MDRAFYFGDPTEGVPKKTAKGIWIVRAKKPCKTVVKVYSDKGGSFKVPVDLK